MSISRQDEVTYSKVNIKKIVEHKKLFGIPDDKLGLDLMALSEYRDMVHREAFFFVDHDGYLRHQFSGELLASSKEQLEILIEQLKGMSKFLDGAIDCVK